MTRQGPKQLAKRIHPALTRPSCRRLTPCSFPPPPSPQQTIPCDNTFGKFFAYTLHEPIGVLGQIIPWSE